MSEPGLFPGEGRGPDFFPFSWTPASAGELRAG